MEKKIFRKCRNCGGITEYKEYGEDWTLTLHRNFPDGLVSNRYVLLACTKCGGMIKIIRKKGPPAPSSWEKHVNTVIERALKEALRGGA